MLKKLFKKKFVKIFLRQDILYWYIYLVQFISNLYCRVRWPDHGRNMIKGFSESSFNVDSEYI